MTNGWTVWLKIGGSVLLALGGLVLALSLNTSITHADPIPPFIATSPGSRVTTIPTPTLPARLALLSPAFAFAGGSGELTIAYDRLPDGTLPLLVYRPNAASSWQKIHVRVNETARRIVVPDAPMGEYALVKVVAPATLPGNAVVVDDQSAEFTRHGPSGNWHDATYPASAYYLGHAYWTSNTYGTVENWGVWTPPTLDGPHEVLVFVPANYADTTYATYWVQHTGHGDWRPVNQSIYWAEWVSLGVFTFTAGTESYVYLSDVTYEQYGAHWVAFDAVAFVPMRLYLPLVVRNWPPPAPQQRSGIHMGNRIYADWSSDMLAPFSPETGGKWPRIVVAQSNQVFNINRYEEPDCRIQNVSVKNWNLFNYLRDAAQAGTRVVIRITPSPGNFEESIDPAWPDPATRPAGRTLITEAGVRPGGWPQCGNDWRYRPVDDIGDEMIAIQRFILWLSPMGYQWQAFGFEPANEPNAEWYSNPDGPNPNPNYQAKESWQAMDQYFANLYDYVHNNAGQLPVRVLTPPMAQSAYAETNNINSDEVGCPPFIFSGYGQMSLTFNSADPKNDGYSWHNYWVAGREAWADCPNGQHVSMWFPDTMESNIQNGVRPAIITEADLASPRQGMGNSLTDKDHTPTLTATSLRDFLFQEAMAECTAVWLLSDDTGSDTDHTWHQAYTSTTGFRAWFTEWWENSENP